MINKKITIEMQLGSEFQLHHFNIMKMYIDALALQVNNRHSGYPQFNHKDNKITVKYE